MGTKKAILKNLGAGSLIQISNILIRFIQVPILISFLGVKEYGQWLVIYSFPMLFSMANFGFGSVAANDIVLMSASKDYLKANKVYSTTFALLILIAIIGSLIIILITPFYNWSSYLEIEASHQKELVWAIIFLGTSVFISMPTSVWSGKLRAANKAHLSILIAGIKPWSNFIGLIIVLTFTTRFDMLALASLISTIIYIVAYYIISHKNYPHLRYSVKNFDKKYIKSLFANGVSFQTLAIGNAIQNQGMLLVIQGILGPVQVAIYSTVRTATNTAIQAMGLINQVTWPEFSMLIGKGELKKAARLHHIGSLTSYIISIGGFVFLLTLGPLLIRLWTNGNIIIERNILFYFIIIIPFVASYATSAAVLASCNQIKTQAKLFFIGTFVNILLCWFFTKLWGLSGAAISASAVYIISFHYVINKAISVTGDTSSGFIKGIITEARSFILRK